jgi:uncharacterized protein YcaQ
LSARDRISAAEARALLLRGARLTDARKRATSASVTRLVQKLGFVQLDSIQRVERAHHLILGARLTGYRPELLDRAAFRERALFEHWTHDASLVPIEHLPHWKHRFAKAEARARASQWFNGRLGDDPDRTIASVRDRIEREGPLMAKDFAREAPRKSAGWWDWSPEKAALELLWRMGVLAVAERVEFHKVYDLMERVHPEAIAAAAPEHAEHVDWAMTTALERLGAATPAELAAFWNAISIADGAAWARAAIADGRAKPVTIESEDGSAPRQGVALADHRRRLSRVAPPPDELRLLAPFDPLIRDRKRLLRLFGFDYRFEAFTPAEARVHGYYVMPLLERDRLVGRLDPRHDRDRAALVVEGLWWEPGVKPTRARLRALDVALEELAERIGATSIEMTRRAKRSQR